MLSIKGLDKAAVLAALVNAARPLVMGVLSDDGRPMTIVEAQKWIDDGRSHDYNYTGPGSGSIVFNRRLRFDYVKGRPIKVDLAGDEFSEQLYDRDQGAGAAARVIEALRRTSL